MEVQPQPSNYRLRRSIYELQSDYEQGSLPNGNPELKKPLEDLMRAWKHMKARDFNDKQSFFILGGYHGEPFRGEGETDSQWWGGYCQHYNILFPTWHRALLIKIEEALRSVPGCENVTMPFWDITAADSLKNGIPWPLTVEKFEVDGVLEKNPLRSYVLPVALVDQVDGDEPGNNMSKPKGYETVRYPLSGLAGTPDDVATAKIQNAKYPTYNETVPLLNGNVQAWLNKDSEYGMYQQYETCLKAPNYMTFSNPLSANAWGKSNSSATPISVESPHNQVHLSVGGFRPPTLVSPDAKFDPGSFGDMCENETAGFDPIFYFHHTNVDRVFWLWQTLKNKQDELDYIPNYPGTNTSDKGTEPTAAQSLNQNLDLNTYLYPFIKQTINGQDIPYTSMDVVNIEKQLGYTYDEGSFASTLKSFLMAAGSMVTPSPVAKLSVSNIDRAAIPGSFIVEASLRTSDGQLHHVGSQSILSRFNVKKCKNCQNHLEVEVIFDLHKDPKDAKFEVNILTHPINPANTNILKNFEDMKKNIKTTIIRN